MAQLKAEKLKSVIEWIEYDKFEDVEYLAKGGFGTTFKAVWKDGPWTINNSQLEREGETKVALKCLHNSQGITTEFLKEVESNILVYDSGWIVRCFEYSDSLKMDFTKLDINSKEESN
ncbi:kinase-like domain-containing protein [Rhizophagus irregularis DAOM 181602=DAOM 197198]|nr:kinase-like domain-containing protein [Rhizophagus irregularis DAOM 181602=DAOM 197198]